MKKPSTVTEARPIGDVVKKIDDASRLAQLVERITCNDEVSRSSRLMGTYIAHPYF